MQLDADAVRIGQPGLIGVVGAHFFLARRVAGGGDGGVDAVDRIDLETEMVDRIRAGFGRFALKEFEIIAVAGLQVEADRFVVAPEVERFFEPEPLAVETGGPAEIGYTDAEMGNPFDHDADSFSVFVDWC
ncbi:MAG: hypothetical protein V8T86_16585 [Victivallis sp.]